MARLAEHLASASFTQDRATSQRQISPHTALQSHDSHQLLHYDMPCIRSAVLAY